MEKQRVYESAKRHDIQVSRLLTLGNTKTARGEAKGYLTAILHLAPADLSGRNVCPMAELAGCIAGCLNTSGHGGTAKGNATFTRNGRTVPDNPIQHCRIRRTEWYHSDRPAFLAALVLRIEQLQTQAARKGLELVVRLNGTSDIRWETGHFVERDGELYRSIMDAFPELTFYDYTKIPNRRALPDNYHLVWSYSEADPKYAAMAPSNMSHAVVFRVPKGQPLPERFMGRAVIDGDVDDLRFLDPENVVVGLRAKGAAKQDQSGFVIDVI